MQTERTDPATTQLGQAEDSDPTSARMKADEFGFLVNCRGLSIETAARLVGCDPVPPSPGAGRRVGYLPLPHEIAAECARLRRWGYDDEG